MKRAKSVHLSQTGQQTTADAQGFLDRQRPFGQTFLERDAGDVRGDEEELIVVAPVPASIFCCTASAIASAFPSTMEKRSGTIGPM